MDPESLHTARLRLDRFTDGDRALLARLAHDPAVMRYIGEGTPWPAERIDAVAAHLLAHWAEHGFGWRVARRRENAEAIGLITLGYAGEGSGVGADEHEIGWWLAPSAWGQGLAREGAAAVRNEAFSRVQAPGVVARISPANAASLAVATAIGLRREADSVGRFGEPIAVARLSAGDWRR
ncbi:MAG TPA: GNAT family N-acetyltransferase [Solirubrobacteraceae bacterium]|nr:GNAT family N-acetyltransferase [Solirubrobacteraceae bacterium]